ncbi:hypothetical protein VTJ83DRAFT_7453 [Remersonia thermophila]|uniref:DNA/RNA-binding protein Alba-like domain-containing protein n=1 Tax=Remersonia thermophila TaxID=72144 RepID=A0ABR4D3P5_9PEZI
MATSAAQMNPSGPFPTASCQGGKRKLPSDTTAEPISNKRQAAGQQLETQAEQLRVYSTTASRSSRSNSSSRGNGNSNGNGNNNNNNNSPYTQIYRPLIDRLSPSFDVQPMSVMPSTSIRGHVDRALSHLGRFSPWDLSVRPGVVVLCARSPAAAKLVTIAELVRRRVGEAEQKWYQYNVVSETVAPEAAAGTQARERPRARAWGAAPPPPPPLSVEEEEEEEEAAMGRQKGQEDEGDGGVEEEEEDEDGEYFETMARPATIHDAAVQPPRTRYTAYVTILLSRVPVAELHSDPGIAVQTNEQTIEYLRKKKMGLVG